MQSPPGTPQVAVALRTPELLHWGFDPVSVLNDVHTAYEGEKVADVYEGNRVFPVTVILPPDARTRMDSISALPIKNPEGVYIPLGRLANVYETSGRYVILHDGARRVQTITLNVAGAMSMPSSRRLRSRLLRRSRFLPATTSNSVAQQKLRPSHAVISWFIPR